MIEILTWWWFVISFFCYIANVKHRPKEYSLFDAIWIYAVLFPLGPVLVAAMMAVEITL